MGLKKEQGKSILGAATVLRFLPPLKQRLLVNHPSGRLVCSLKEEHEAIQDLGHQEAEKGYPDGNESLYMKDENLIAFILMPKNAGIQADALKQKTGNLTNPRD